MEVEGQFLVFANMPARVKLMRELVLNARLAMFQKNARIHQSCPGASAEELETLFIRLYFFSPMRTQR